MQQSPLLTIKQAIGIAVLMIIGLWLDYKIPLWGQIGVGIFFWALFLVFYLYQSAKNRRMLMLCLVLATVGEIFCSLIWGLYEYRLHNIPHYVPPGHVLLFLIGTVLAPRLPAWTGYLLAALVTPYIIVGFYLGFDEFGLVLFSMFLACMISAPGERLYPTMFLLSLLLEIYGTYLGNWYWPAEVNYWGLSNTNPPLASGAFYCVLDFLVLLFLRPHYAIQGTTPALKKTENLCPIAA